MSASRTPAPGSSLLLAPSASAAFEYVAEFSFKGVQAGVEQFPPWHDHDIEPGSELVATEYLANEPLGPVPHDGAAKLPGRRNTETACFESVGQTEQRERSTVDLDAAVVNILVLGSFPDTLGTAEARLGHEFGLPDLFAAHGQPLPALRASALEDEAAVFRGHANEEAVRLTTTTVIWLECTLALQDTLLT